MSSECECWHCHHIRILPHEPLKRGKRGEATLAALAFPLPVVRRERTAQAYRLPSAAELVIPR
jgi:hypothetical protein